MELIVGIEQGSLLEVLIMKTLIVFAIVCVATVSCFNLPMVFNIGTVSSSMTRIDHLVEAAGPFVLPRNVTFNFQWDAESYNMYGVRIRGTEPRYDVNYLYNDERY